MDINYATNFALVEDGIVTNVLWGLIYNTPTDFSAAVQTDDLAVQTGDTYDGASFYHEGEKVKTRQEIIDDMQAALAELGVTE